MAQMRWRRGRESGAESDSEWVGWREADMRPARGRAGVRLIRVLAWTTAVSGFVVLLMEIQRDTDRCHQNCFDGSDNTFEAGHVWTAYFGSWQWDAQLVLGWAAVLSGFLALYVAGRRGRWWTVASLGLALGCIAVWIVWVTVQPPPGRLA
jgi:hypothetical protein